MDVPDRWRLVSDAEAALREGREIEGVPEDIVAKARANLRHRERMQRRRAELEAVWERSVAEAIDEIVKQPAPLRLWNDPDVLVAAAGEYERTPAVRAVERFAADRDLRFLVLLGGVGVGKTFGAVTGGVEWQRERLRLRLEQESERERAAIADSEARSPQQAGTFATMLSDAAPSEAIAEWLHGIGRTRPPSRGFAMWPASKLPQLWEPWRDEVEAGAEPADRSTPYIVLDDLGTERESARFHEALGQFVEHRMLGGKTVITTNLVRADIRARYGDRIADRINHVGKSFALEGPSRRRQQAGL
jgi:DNA replication protein DnaC